MALRRRSGARFEANIWPGFVDAMTALLLVLIFVLSIFMVIQFVLRDMITGQDRQLDNLTAELASLAHVLSLEEAKSTDLEARIGTLRASLDDATAENDRMNALVANLTAERDGALARAASFEEQIAGLLADLDRAQTNIAGLEAERDNKISEAEALNLALANLREEISKAEEEARLAAAKREAMEALVAQLEAQNTAQDAKLTKIETDRALEAAAAEALRNKLENADTELTSMTLALEEQRKKAEETLTLLAAANAAKDDLQGQLDKATIDLSDREAMLIVANQALADEKSLSADAARRVALLNSQTVELRRQLGSLQSLLDEARQKDADSKVQLTNLGSQLNAALARELALQRREEQRMVEDAKRLAEENKKLETYRSNFFGRIREVLQGRKGIEIVGDRFVFQSEVLFASGSAQIGDDGKAQLSQLASVLKEVADEIPEDVPWILRIDGHTDDAPLGNNTRYADNWALSQARALSVVRYLVDVEGFDPARLSANGFGQYQPVAFGDTAAARAQNRRIELKLTER